MFVTLEAAVAYSWPYDSQPRFNQVMWSFYF